MTLVAPPASTPKPGSSPGAGLGGPQPADGHSVEPTQAGGEVVAAPAGCADGPGELLVDGFDHVAVLTADTDRLVRFYQEMFGASVEGIAHDANGTCLTVIKVGAKARLNVFEIAGNDQARRPAPMFARGRLDHLGLQATSLDSFDTMRDRLVAARASDGFVTDFGDILSLWFRDPDGLEGEVCIANPDAQPGVYHPPGTPSRRHHAPPQAVPGRAHDGTVERTDT